MTSRLDEIRQPDAKQHANCGDITIIEIGSRILTWRTFMFSKRKWLYLSHELRYVDEIWFADRF